MLPARCSVPRPVINNYPVISWEPSPPETQSPCQRIAKHSIKCQFWAENTIHFVWSWTRPWFPRPMLARAPRALLDPVPKIRHLIAFGLLLHLPARGAQEHLFVLLLLHFFYLKISSKLRTKSRFCAFWLQLGKSQSLVGWFSSGWNAQITGFLELVGLLICWLLRLQIWYPINFYV